MQLMKGMTIATALAATLSTTTLVQAADIDDAIEYRQSVFSVMAWHFGPMGAMAQGKIDYDPEEFARRAEAVNAVAGMPWEGFVEGSYIGGDHGADTDAMAKIAGNQDDIQQRVETFMAETATLAEVAQEGDFASSRRAFATVANSCKGCHDNYRDN